LLDPGDQALQLESVASDPVTGRLILVQQGHWEHANTTNYLWVLSPIRDVTLTVEKDNLGTISFDPEPNDANAPEYPSGTIVTLTATPNDGTGFKQWVIYDPNYPGDANHATIDSNTVITITVNNDMEIEAAFKCGSGGGPFLPMILLGLGVFAFVRRRL